MRYRRREAEATLRSLMGQFKVVLITGARQVGKTTMLQHNETQIASRHA